MNIGPRYEQRRAQIERDYAAFSRKATRLCIAESILELIRDGADVADLIAAFFRGEEITSKQIAARGMEARQGRDPTGARWRSHDSPVRRTRPERIWQQAERERDMSNHEFNAVFPLRTKKQEPQ